MSLGKIVLVVVGILVAIGVVLALSVSGIFNRLVTLQQGTDAAWAQVQNVYQRRADLVPNLVNTVKGAANFERGTLTEIFDTYQVDRCDFLKLDCEGAEYEILLNLPITYLQRVSRIALEWHGVEDPAVRRSQSNSLVERLVSAGFEIETYWEYVGFRCGMIRATRARAPEVSA